MENVMERLADVFEWFYERYPPIVIVAVGTFVLHELFYFIHYIPYAIAEQIPSLRKYKIQPDKDNSIPLQWKTFKHVLFIHTLYQLPLMALSHDVLHFLGCGQRPPFPTWTTMLSQCVLFYFIEDFYFYWIHRLLHWGPFYKYIHKVHHEHTAPFGIVGEYAHPAETLFLGLGSVAGPFLLKSHLLTLWVWLFFRIWQVIDAHSGYNFPWSLNRFIPFWGGADFHDFHHMTFVGNYASTFRIWDYVFGTDTKYYAWKEKQKTATSKAQ
eukprot:TRINITY_DN12515_c0_g1_i1.p1 TRINITY_DN12515_c0_g1~~TRINITY_DN12515_c0_g1_i1.p1  ORF type:complete len:268 (+),score=51.62 TRINITY_DN12515_c0_g1_i1:78-881(+)